MWLQSFHSNSWLRLHRMQGFRIHLGNSCRWRRDFRDKSFSRGMTIFALHGWSTTGEEKVSRGVDKSSVDRSRRAREETEVDNRTAVLRLHKLKHCEVARKKCGNGDCSNDGSECLRRHVRRRLILRSKEGSLWEIILPLLPRGRLKDFSNQFLVFPCESASLRVTAVLTCAERCRNIRTFT